MVLSSIRQMADLGIWRDALLNSLICRERSQGFSGARGAEMTGVSPAHAEPASGGRRMVISHQHAPQGDWQTCRHRTAIAVTN